MKRAYLDHNATTPMRPEVRARLAELASGPPLNASSVHASGRRARQLLDEARERVAGALGVLEDEIVFTGGGTEANNLAVMGAVRAAGPGAVLATTAVEHSSVLGPAAALEAEGHPVHRVPVDAEGRPAAEAVLKAARGARVLSVMAANNEVGALGPLAAIGAGLAELPPRERPVFHTDAVQALGRVPVELCAWRADLASFSAHKVGGPQGVGVLYRRKGTALLPLGHGGGQETGLRPGTENVAGIVAGALAVELAVLEQAELAARTRALSAALWHEVRVSLPSASLLGPAIDSAERLPNTLCLSIPGAEGRVLVTRLDLAGLEVSAGSACASGALEPSHVLTAMGLDEERARAGLRISLGRTTSEQDIHTAVDILRKTFLRARKCS